jgi:hypothetical protein
MSAPGVHRLPPVLRGDVGATTSPLPAVMLRVVVVVVAMALPLTEGDPIN